MKRFNEYQIKFMERFYEKYLSCFNYDGTSEEEEIKAMNNANSLKKDWISSSLENGLFDNEEQFEILFMEVCQNDHRSMAYC